MSSQNLAVRLNKLVASKVPCSRKEAEAFIAKGFVWIDGEVADSPGRKVPVTANLRLDDRIQAVQKVTIAVHKPLGFVSSQPEEGKIPAIQLLTKENEFRKHRQYQPKFTERQPEPYKLPKMAVAGRLDIHTTGLLLFTQCGATAANIIGSDNSVEKEYLVRLRLKNHEKLDPDAAAIQSKLQQLRHGIQDGGEFLRATTVEVQNVDQLRITLTTGKNHQIRRMIRAVGWTIQAIKRVRIGELRLGNLPVGKWRYVDASREILRL